jgi:hypothetical protein
MFDPSVNYQTLSGEDEDEISVSYISYNGIWTEIKRPSVVSRNRWSLFYEGVHFHGPSETYWLLREERNNYDRPTLTRVIPVERMAIFYETLKDNSKT